MFCQKLQTGFQQMKSKFIAAQKAPDFHSVVLSDGQPMQHTLTVCVLFDRKAICPILVTDFSPLPLNYASSYPPSTCLIKADNPWEVNIWKESVKPIFM